jgi:hypothetical protein
MSSMLITPKTFVAVRAAYGFIQRFSDVFRKEETLRIIATGPDYVEVAVLWGLVHFERGEKKEFIIKGPPGFCKAVLEQMKLQGSNLKILEG